MKTIAYYPGSFNPFHVGHLNIVEKAERIFGKGNVVVAIGVNPEKVQFGSNDPESVEKVTKVMTEKCQELSKSIGREVVYYIGFLHDFVSARESYSNVAVIRGLRNGNDLDYEVNQIRFMDDFKKGNKMNFCFLMCDKEFEHISSSSIRVIKDIDNELSKKYLV